MSKAQPEAPRGSAPRTDIILPMSRTPTQDWMQLIVSRHKTHEFRKVLYAPTVRRIWFYETAPISSITYICDIGPPIHRPPEIHPHPSAQHSFLPEDGSVGHTEFNNYAADYEGYDYAYPIVSCSRLTEPISLGAMKADWGFKGAPRGMMYVPDALREVIDIAKQDRIW